MCVREGWVGYRILHLCKGCVFWSHRSLLHLTVLIVRAAVLHLCTHNSHTHTHTHTHTQPHTHFSRLIRVNSFFDQFSSQPRLKLRQHLLCCNAL